MISSPEAAKLVLVTKAHLFKPTFPASKERMLGKQAIFFHQGEYHAKLRKLVLRAFKPEAIKNIVPDIESIAITSLQSMQGRLINTYQEMKTVCFIIMFSCPKKKKQGKTESPVFFLCFPPVFVLFSIWQHFCSTHTTLHCFRYLAKMKCCTGRI